METIVSSYRHLLAAPEHLNSFLGFLLGLIEVTALAALLAWPLALFIKLLLSREKLGTATRLQFTVLWTSIFLGALSLGDVVVLLILDRVPGWDAVTPHTSFSFGMGLIAIFSYFEIRSELGALRDCVDNAKKQAL